MTSSALAMNSTSYAKINIGIGPAAREIKVWGKIGNLLALGLTPEQSGILGENGEDRLVTRKAHRRARWLGDIVKSGVRSNQALSVIYPSRRGSALPGKPVKIIDLNSETAAGNRRTVQVQVDGDIGQFIEYLTEHPLSFDAKVVGPRGSRYMGIIPKAEAGG